MDATTAALVVAALAVLSGPVTAYLTFRWSRRAEQERWAREHDADRERFAREEQRRRVLRGEEAAKEILTAVDEANIALSKWRNDDDDPPLEADLRPLYNRIKQQAELLTDEAVHVRVMTIASNLYYHGQTLELVPILTRWTIGHTCADAAHRILRAYLHGQPPPPTPRMDRLNEIHEEGGDLLSKMYERDEFDPLDPPELPLSD